MATSDQGLRDRTVVVTRDEDADGPLTSELEFRGARVLHWPTVRISPPADTKPLDEALGNLARFDWIAFTSARSVSAVLSRLPVSYEPPHALRVAAVGAGTARALRDAGWPVDVEPEEHSSIALVQLLAAHGVSGTRVLFPASSLAGRGLVQGLNEEGASVDEVVAYRTLRLPLAPQARSWITAVLGGPEEEVEPAPAVDAICFASPSAVDAWREALNPARFAEFGRRVLVGAIGATTAAALRSAGCVDLAVAQESTFIGLVDAIEEAMARSAAG